MSSVRVVGLANVCLIFLLSACGGGGIEPPADVPGTSSPPISSADPSPDDDPAKVDPPEESSSSSEGSNESSSLSSSFSSSQSSSVPSADSSSSASPPIVTGPINTEEPVTEGPEGYVFCVNEAEWIDRETPNVCWFDGTRTVAYGADGQFNYGVATGVHVCNNTAIDDPIQGSRKACFVSVELAGSDESSSSSSSSSVPVSSSSSSSSNDIDLGDAAFVCEAPKPAELSANYVTACAACHGGTGGGGVGPSLRGAQFASLADFEQVIRQGQGIMMPFNTSQYTDEALRNDFAFFTHDDFCADSDPGSSPGTLSSCEVRDELLEPQLRRLTQAELVNTIVAVFGDRFDSSVWPELGDAIPTIGMSNIASTLQVDSVNLERIHDTVSAVVAQLLNTTARDCINGRGNSCIDNLLVEYAPQLWRRPMAADELMDLTDALDEVRAEGGSRGQQVEFIFRSLLMSPNFLFRMELGDLQGQVRYLDSYEIASLLSYALWESPPDATLYALAEAGSLTDQAVIDEQVDRMMADPRFQGALVGFLKDFLKLDRVLTVEKIADLNFSSAQRQALLASAERMLADKVSDIDQDLMSVFTGHEFYINSDIAPLFGLDSSQFGSELTLTSVSQAQRTGVLTHPAFLAVHATSGTSGIVKRGVFALQQLLCVSLGDPPDDLTEAPLPPEVDPATTTTRVLLQLQHSHQAACVGCHQAIDPAGFGFESYDVLGRYQTVEKGNLPIDSSGLLRNVVRDPIEFANHIEYVEGLVSAPEMRSCVSRRMLESFSGQNVAPNACELDHLNHQINQNETTIRGLIKSLTQLESVRLRIQ